MCLSAYRIHSIFVLRLFNDPIAMTFLYISIVFLLRRQWTIACILYRFNKNEFIYLIIFLLFFSLAVSIKMNIILMAPALFIILLLSVGLQATFKNIFYCALLQVRLEIFVCFFSIFIICSWYLLSHFFYQILLLI